MGRTKPQVVVQDIRRYHAQVDPLLVGKIQGTWPMSAESKPAWAAAHVASHALIYVYRGVIHGDAETMLSGSPVPNAHALTVVDRDGEGYLVAIYASSRAWEAVNRAKTLGVRSVHDYATPFSEEVAFFAVAPSAARQLRALWEWADAEVVSKGVMKDGVLHVDSHTALRGRDPIDNLLRNYDTDDAMKRLTDRILGNANLAGVRTRGVKRTRGLRGAPGDVDAFVSETTDAAIVHLERAFQRAGLTVAGKPLTARFSGQWMWPNIIFDESVAMGYRAGGAGRRPFAYAWFARRFVAGGIGRPLMNAWGREVGEAAGAGGDYEGYRDVDIQAALAAEVGDDEWLLRVTRLGVDIQRLSRNTWRELIDWGPGRQRKNVNFAETMQQIREGIRQRLNWPRVDSYDPSPPSQWPEAE